MSFVEGYTGQVARSGGICLVLVSSALVYLLSFRIEQVAISPRPYNDRLHTAYTRYTSKLLRLEQRPSWKGSK